MTEHSVVHGTFTIERDYATSPARVFAAFAKLETKRRWFAEGEAWEVQEFTLDFRVGGRESARFRFNGGQEAGPAKGTEVRNDTTYLDIVPEHRIVIAYTMAVGGKRMSASLATVELVASAGGTRLTYTEQGAFFDGIDKPQSREAGWRVLLESLDRELRKPA